MPRAYIRRVPRGAPRGAERPRCGDPLNLIRVMPAKGRKSCLNQQTLRRHARIAPREREVQASVFASIFLARLLGPLLLLPGIGILLSPRVFRAMAQDVIGSVTLLYLFGLIDFAAGLAIVLTHNVWLLSWRVLITLIGWLLLVRGAIRI